MAISSPRASESSRRGRGLAATAALFIAFGTAAAALSAHFGDAQQRQRLASAALILLSNGPALLALGLFQRFAAERRRWLHIAGMWLAASTLLFAGSLLVVVFAGTGTSLAPIGGGGLILGWLALAILLIASKDGA